MLVDGQIDSGPHLSSERNLEIGALAEHARPPQLTVEEGEEGIAVDTSSIRVVIRVGGSFPFERVVAGGRDVLDTDAKGLTVTDSAGHVAAVQVQRVAVEHRSALRTSVRIDADCAVADRRMWFIGRLDFFAGHGAVRFRCTIRNPDHARHPGNFWDLGDSGSVLIGDLSLTLGWPSAVSAMEAALSLTHGAALEPLKLPCELYQDSSGGEHWQSTNHITRNREVPTRFRGYRLRSGDVETHGHRATPMLRVAFDGGSIGAVVPAFWQNFPRSLEADERSLRVRFFPAQHADLHELQGGEQKTHECFLTFGPDLVGCDYDWCRAPTILSVDPEWVVATGAVDGLAPLESGHRELVNQAIEGPDSFERKREVVDEYGWRHFGDIYGDHETPRHQGPAPLVSHYNNQYDPVLGFGLQYLRTGDHRWFVAMDELARHVIDIDIYHTTRDKAAYNGGLFWHTYHYGDADTSTHRTYPRRNTGTVFGGGPSADHNYPSGLLLHYFLTGDAASREAVVGLAEYVLNLEDGSLSPFRFLSRADTGRSIFTPPDYYGPSRSSGNSLNALVDGHRATGEARFLAAAAQLVRRVVHPDEDPGRHRLDEPEYRWFYLMFLQSLGKYLVHRAALNLVDDDYAYGRASLLTYARWMVTHEYPYLERPERLEFPTETWAAQDIRKSDVFYYAAMLVSGDERKLFVQRGAFFHRQSTETLAGMPTRRFARPVIVVSTSGFLHGWFRDHPESRLPTPKVEPDYGQPSIFIPQRAIAERRVKVIAVVGSLTVLLISLAVVVLL